MPVAKKLFTITAIAPTTIYSNDAAPVDAMRVDFNVVGQVVDYLTIPKADFDPETVDALVTDLASDIVRVLNLEGPSVHVSADGKVSPPPAES